MSGSYNCVVLLGPTAVGKTSLGVAIARHYGWDIISADSRQVYRGLDLGSGKDLSEYTSGGEPVKTHLIDITTLHEEYNVFRFQNDFYTIAKDFLSEGKTPFVVGGTGMYIDSVARGYDFVPVPENEKLREELSKKSLEELDAMLLSLRPNLHNKSDLLIRERVVRAIEIETFMKSEECRELRKSLPQRPDIKCLLIGTTLPREKLHANIKKRLRERMEAGMVEEVKNLHEKDGFSWERLEKLGLEYRFISEYLEGKIKSEEEMEEKLYHAICQFAKRQETWFRGMQKKGAAIHFLPSDVGYKEKLSAAFKLIDSKR